MGKNNKTLKMAEIMELINKIGACYIASLAADLSVVAKEMNGQHAKFKTTTEHLAISLNGVTSGLSQLMETVNRIQLSASLPAERG